MYLNKNNPFCTTHYPEDGSQIGALKGDGGPEEGLDKDLLESYINHKGSFPDDVVNVDAAEKIIQKLAVELDELKKVGAEVDAVIAMRKETTTAAESTLTGNDAGNTDVAVGKVIEDGEITKAGKDAMMREIEHIQAIVEDVDDVEKTGDAVDEVNKGDSISEGGENVITGETELTGEGAKVDTVVGEMRGTLTANGSTSPVNDVGKTDVAVDEVSKEDVVPEIGEDEIMGETLLGDKKAKVDDGKKDVASVTGATKSSEMKDVTSEGELRGEGDKVASRDDDIDHITTTALTVDEVEKTNVEAEVGEVPIIGRTELGDEEAKVCSVDGGKDDIAPVRESTNSSEKKDAASESNTEDEMGNLEPGPATVTGSTKTSGAKKVTSEGKTVEKVDNVEPAPKRGRKNVKTTSHYERVPAKKRAKNSK